MDQDVANRPPVDLTHLARHTMGDAQLKREVLELFVAQSRLQLERLRGAPDAALWRTAAHTIKGAARGIGAWSVAARAEAAETTPFKPGDSACHAALESLAREVDAARRYIDGLLADG